MNNVSTINLPVSTFGNVDDILVNASGSAGRIKKTDFLGSMNDWSNVMNKPFDNFNNTYFRTTERSDGADILTLSDSVVTYFGKVDNLQSDLSALETTVQDNYDYYQRAVNSLSSAISSVANNMGQALNETKERVSNLENNAHTHDNKAVIDLFTMSDNKLLWNGTTVGSDYELPIATSSLLGGVKPDGTTITVDSDGTIHGASQGLDFEALSTAMTTGTQSGITVTADTENSRFNFEVTGIPTIAIDSEGYWTVNGERGANPTKAQGEKGDRGTDGTNGVDGISPHIDETSKHWFIGETDTGVSATASIDDASITGTDVSWSAKKLSDTIGDINTILASVTGGIS